MKKCFYCERKLPLFMFALNRRAYQRPEDKGRCKSCHICNYKFWSRDGYTWLLNLSTQKFERVEFKSKLDIIKRILYGTRKI